MEFPFDVQELFPGKHPVCLVNYRLEVVNCETSLKAPQSRSRFKDTTAKEPPNRNWKNLFEVVNRIGDASAKAQGLLTSVTTAEKLLNSQHRLYVLREGNCIVGILKMGSKRLFVVDTEGSLHECMANCVLDFYVQEQMQRKGYGKKLFDTMLQAEDTSPERLAIDRPSPKLIAFLQKHYNLSHSIPQANNFVVFESFFPKSKSNDVPIPRQRHSYCGETQDISNVEKIEKAKRPRSLVGIIGWPNGSDEESNSAIGAMKSKSETKDRSSSTSGGSFGSPNLSSHLNRRPCSSWNVFGVPPPDYLESQASSGQQSRMS